MKLYHISPYQEGDSLIKKFVPRIPSCTYDTEDKMTPRICFSESIEGCFDAVPFSTGYQINAAGERFILFEIETSDYPEDYFVMNKEIVKRALVPDANTTKECWLIKPVSLKGCVCELTDIERDLILDFSMLTAEDVIMKARWITKDLFRIFEADELEYLKLFSAEQAYNTIIDRADKNKVWALCDDLFYLLGEYKPDAQRTKTKISFFKVQKEKSEIELC